MGCYEVSLGDTVGMARPWEVRDVVEEVKKDVKVSKLAVRYCFVTFCFSILTTLHRAMYAEPISLHKA